MVEKESNVIAAKKRAQEIVDEAEQKSADLRRASSAYADELLRKTEDTLNQSLDGVRRSRMSFRSASGYSEE